MVHPVPCSSLYDHTLIIRFGISSCKKSSYLNFNSTIFEVIFVVLVVVVADQKKIFELVRVLDQFLFLLGKFPTFNLFF